MTSCYRISFFLRDAFRTRQVRMVCAPNDKVARERAEQIRPANTWKSFNIKRVY
jgi:hypothetical protein